MKHKKAAEAKIQELNEQAIFNKPVITPIKPYKTFILLNPIIKITIKESIAL